MSPSNNIVVPLRKDGRAVTGTGDDRYGGGRTSPDAAFSQDAAATFFSDRYEDAVKYVADEERFIIYDGASWQRDETNKIDDLIRASNRAYVLSIKAANRNNSYANLKATKNLVASDPRHVVLSSDLDKDPALLNCPDGSYNLESGDHKPHDPADLCTRITAVAPSFTDPTDFQNHVNEWSNFRPELADYLARAGGYLLRGDNPEEVFFVIYGNGQNGKSKFKDLLVHVAGNYATQAPSGLFLSSQPINEDNALANLIGPRLAYAEENKPNSPLREDVIKRTTGSQHAKVRAIYRDYKEQRIGFTPLLLINDLPPLSGTGKALRRRLHLIPFEWDCPDDRKDPHLLQKLIQNEASEILGWLITGAVSYAQVGLNKPECMIQIENEYFNEEDTIGAWVNDCVETGPPTLKLKSATAYHSYSRWCDENGATPVTNVLLTRELVNRGFKKGRNREGAFFEAHRLKTPGFE
ncbi:MAG: phage/plasmid primase, P4 family [Pseudomonadota bacterium]